MNRSKQMDEFLQYWAKIYLQNPSYPVEEENLYTALMNYGLTEQEKTNPSIKSIFPAWISHFQNNPNLEVYHDERQAAFLQFRSPKYYGEKHVKLYLSYPATQMEYCAKKIFEYIANHNMKTISKVADRIRSDSIVLRMDNYDDSMKVMNFINRDPELVMYARATNPFIIRNGKVGVSYDDLISYNGTLTLMMQEYFNVCRKNNTLDKVNHRDFRDFVSAYYQATFRDPRLLDQFLNNPKVSYMSRKFETPGECLMNYSQVLKLMIMQLDESMSMERYRSFYVDAKDSTKASQMINYYDELLDNYYYSKKTTPKEQEKTASLEEIALINEYLLYAMEKYGSADKAIAYLKKYIATRDVNMITRDRDFRFRFDQLLSPKRVHYIVSGDVRSYMEALLQPVKEEETPTISNDEEVLQRFIDYARGQYGDAKVAFKINQHLKGEEAIRPEQAYRRFSQLSKKRIQEIADNNIFTYVQSYIQSKNQEMGRKKDLEELYRVFISASVATYQKYGYHQLRAAIENGLNANFVYFTDGTGNYKEKLINITPDEFRNFCEKLLLAHGTHIEEGLELSDNCARAIMGMAIKPNTEVIKTA